MIWQEAGLVAGKDLRIEARSRVAIGQILPFGLIVILLFAFALDPDRGVLAAGGTGPVLGHGAAGDAPRGRPRLRDRDRPRRPRRAAAGRASTAPRSSWARPPRSRSSCCCSRSCSAPAWWSSTGSTCHGWHIVVLTALAATVGHGGHRYPLRRPRGRSPGAGDAGALAAVAGARAGDAGCDPGLRGRRSTACPATRGPGWRCSRVFAALYTAIGMLAFGPLWRKVRDRRPTGTGDQLLAPVVRRVIGWLAVASLVALDALRPVGRAHRRGAGRRAAPHVPPRAGGLARVPRVLRHRARSVLFLVAAAPARWCGTASPARRPSSA